MDTWKRILLKSLGVGLGIGIGLALAVGFYVWYSSRPVPPKPWDASSITASFHVVDTVGDDHHLRFVYILENHTDRDYRVNTPLLVLSAVVHTKDSLTGGNAAKFQDDEIFLPMKQHTEVKIELPSYHFAGKEASDGPDDRRKYREAVKKYANDNLSQLNGFAAFDDVNRYRINFPNGWCETCRSENGK